jgi:hypothetical protein
MGGDDAIYICAKTSKTIRFDGFVLALDILFLMDAIDLDDGLLRRKSP